jgi:hypothetical protein
MAASSSLLLREINPNAAPKNIYEERSKVKWRIGALVTGRHVG